MTAIQNITVAPTTRGTGDFNVAGRHESKRFPDGSSLVRPDQLPWTDWAMPGSYFKLLHINRAHNMFTALVKIDPDVVTPDHYHFGEAHAFVLEGEFSYEYGTMYTGDYIVEGGGIHHQPTIGPKGAVWFVIFYAGLSGVSETGLPQGEMVDGEWMYRAAAANGAAGHLPPPPYQELHAAV